MNIYKAKVACEDYNGSDYCLMPRVQARSEEDAQAVYSWFGMPRTNLRLRIRFPGGQ